MDKMMKVSTPFLFFFVICSGLLPSVAAAEPWFTNPLLAIDAETVPRGKGNLEIYGYNFQNRGEYQRDWSFLPTSHYGSEQIVPELSYGLTDWADVELDVLFMKNHTEGQSYTHIGDTLLMFGFQLLRQEETNFPDIRLTFTEIFPTGRFNDLHSFNNGNDATGGGSYQSALGLSMQHLTQLSENIYLNAHFFINYFYLSPVTLHGISAYGGSSITRGRIRPGNVLNLELSGELSLTQHWVAVMEGFFLMQNASVFNGTIGPIRSGLASAPNGVNRTLLLPFFNGLRPTQFNLGGRGGIGHGNVDQFSLAPAVEYNFSQNIGVIAGPWFTIAGKNIPQFVTAAIALNVSW